MRLRRRHKLFTLNELIPERLAAWGSFINYVDKQGDGVSQRLAYLVYSKLVNEVGMGINNPQNIVNTVFECPLGALGIMAGNVIVIVSCLNETVLTDELN